MDDEPAFPRNHRHEGHNGLTMRDYFAAKAMQALITKGMDDFNKRNSSGVPYVTKYAYEYADAMLKARATPPTKEPTP